MCIINCINLGTWLLWEFRILSLASTIYHLLYMWVIPAIYRSLSLKFPGMAISGKAVVCFDNTVDNNWKIAGKCIADISVFSG